MYEVDQERYDSVTTKYSAICLQVDSLGQFQRCILTPNLLRRNHPPSSILHLLTTIFSESKQQSIPQFVTSTIMKINKYIAASILYYLGASAAPTHVRFLSDVPHNSLLVRYSNSRIAEGSHRPGKQRRRSRYSSRLESK